MTGKQAHTSVTWCNFDTKKSFHIANDNEKIIFNV